MRPPKVENKYQLTMEIARNLDIGDETKVREPLFWRNDVVHAWCISKSIGSDRDEITPPMRCSSSYGRGF